MAKTPRSRRTAPSSNDAASELKVELQQVGPDQRALDAAASRVLRLATVQKHLKNARHRVLSTVLIEAEPTAKPSRPSPPSGRFRSTIYDYTNNRTLLV